MKHLSFGLQSHNRWWKYLALFLASLFGGQTVGGIPLFLVLFYKVFSGKGNIQLSPDNFADLSTFGIDANLGLFLMILPFVASLFFLIVLFKPLHHRSYLTMITGSDKIRWKRFFTGAGIWFALIASWLIIDYSINPESFAFNFDMQQFIVLVIISITLIPLQSSFEEILFRGYLAQGVAGWTRNKWLVILLPSILFGSLHIMNPEVTQYGFWITMPQYVLFGIVFGLVTVLDDGTEIAMGAHSVNNVFLSIFVTSKSSVLQTPALLIQQNVNPVKDLLSIIVLFALFVVVLSLIYKWNYKSLNQKITLDAINQEKA